MKVKYLGLLALARLMKIAPKAVQEHKDTVLACLDDEDITIRQRALDLTVGMVNKRNIADIVKKLMEKLTEADGRNRDDLIVKIIREYGVLSMVSLLFPLLSFFLLPFSFPLSHHL